MADELLRALGLVQADEEPPEVSAECMRIARRLRAADRRVVGLIPVTAEDAVPPVGVRLGIALVQLTGATVAYIDANVRWPALSAIASSGHAAAGQSSAEPNGDSVYATRWLTGTLALLTPPHVEQAGQVVPQLATVLEDGRELFQHTLVDLTGFELLGEHSEAARLMDGVILVGRAGKTKEIDLVAYRDELRTSQFLGVLLVG